MKLLRVLVVLLGMLKQFQPNRLKVPGMLNLSLMT